MDVYRVLDPPLNSVRTLISSFELGKVGFRLGINRESKYSITMTTNTNLMINNDYQRSRLSRCIP